jgi:hypothetical protein
MRILLHATVAVGLVLLPVSASDAAKRVEKPVRHHVSAPVQATPPGFFGGSGPSGDANSMNGSNSATNNANGRTSGGRN